MRPTLPIGLKERFTASSAGCPPSLKVVLVYQDFGMGIQGKQVFDLIAKEAGGERAAELTVWRFDFFCSETMTIALSQQAEEADVIIVAVRDPNYLPPQVRHWLERWPQRRKLPNGALIAVFDPEHGQHAKSSEAALLLWRAAQRATMDYFCRVGDAAAEKHAITRTASGAPYTITHTLRPHLCG